MYTRRTGLGCQVVTDWCTCTAIAILAGPSRATTPSTPAVARPALRWVTCRTLTSVFDHDRSIIFCRFLTLGQSPSRTAVKIRCRSCPTFLSWARQLTASQSRSSPGPFTIMGAYLAPRYVHLHWHQALTGSPGSRQLPFRPSMSWYPAGYPRPRPSRGGGTLALVARCRWRCRPSLPGHPVAPGIPPLLRSAYGHQVPDHDGVSTFRTRQIRPDWVPSVPRDQRCSHGPLVPPARRLPHHSDIVLYPGPDVIYPELHITRRQRGFTRFTRPVFPLPAAPG